MSTSISRASEFGKGFRGLAATSKSGQYKQFIPSELFRENLAAAKNAATISVTPSRAIHSRHGFVKTATFIPRRLTNLTIIMESGTAYILLMFTSLLLVESSSETAFPCADDGTPCVVSAGVYTLPSSDSTSLIRLLGLTSDTGASPPPPPQIWHYLHLTS